MPARVERLILAGIPDDEFYRQDCELDLPRPDYTGITGCEVDDMHGRVSGTHGEQTQLARQVKSKWGKTHGLSLSDRDVGFLFGNVITPDGTAADGASIEALIKPKSANDRPYIVRAPTDAGGQYGLWIKAGPDQSPRQKERL